MTRVSRLVAVVPVVVALLLTSTAAPTAASGQRGPRVVAGTAVSAPGTHVATVRLKAGRKASPARVVLRQVVGGRVVASRAKQVRVTKRSWRPVTVRLASPRSAGRLQLVVRTTRPVLARSPRITPALAVSTPPKRPAPAPAPGPAPTPGPAPVQTPGVDASEWQPDLVEDFDALSPSTWDVADGWGAGNESSWLQTGNVSTVDGVLRVQGRKQSAGGRSYTSGRLDTNNHYALPNYFRAEVRAKVPYQRGLWAAPLWFRPVRGGSGEIDLVETYGSEQRWPTVHQTIHTAYGDGHQFRSQKTLFSKVSSKAPTDWHTYTIEKTPGHIRMWVDGHQSAHFSAASAPWFGEYYEAGKRWNMRVNMQIGGSYGLPDSTTSWSGDDAVMQLDYIKTWVPRS